jgi:hypothetical protein
LRWFRCVAHHSQSEYDSRKKVEVEGTREQGGMESRTLDSCDVINDKGEKVNCWDSVPNTHACRGWTRIH